MMVVRAVSIFYIKDISAHPDGETDSRGRHPMVEVSWYGAQFYCWYLNEVDEVADQCLDLSDWSVDFQAGWRLPTEAG